MHENINKWIKTQEKLLKSTQATLHMNQTQTNLEVRGEAEKRRAWENSCQQTNDANNMSQKNIWEQLDSNRSLLKVNMSSKLTLFIVLLCSIGI